MLKPEIRILGFDDGPFKRGDKKVLVVGVVYRGGKYPDGFLKTDVDVDGLDATEKMIKFINSSRHKQQLKVIMFDGITFGGFNIIDIKQVNKKTGLPVIVINRKHPDIKQVRNALKIFKDFRKRWKMIKSAGSIKEFSLNIGRKIYYQSIGMADEDAEDAIRISTTNSQIPEVLRVAHLIATAIVKGESGGRA